MITLRESKKVKGHECSKADMKRMHLHQKTFTLPKNLAVTSQGKTITLAQIRVSDKVALRGEKVKGQQPVFKCLDRLAPKKQFSRTT